MTYFKIQNKLEIHYLYTLCKLFQKLEILLTHDYFNNIKKINLQQIYSEAPEAAHTCRLSLSTKGTYQQSTDKRWHRSKKNTYYHFYLVRRRVYMTSRVAAREHTFTSAGESATWGAGWASPTNTGLLFDPAHTMPRLQTRHVYRSHARLHFISAPSICINLFFFLFRIDVKMGRNCCLLSSYVDRDGFSYCLLLMQII